MTKPPINPAKRMFCSFASINRIAVAGAAALIAYLGPLRPYLGFLSIGLIGFGLYKELELVKTLKRCKNCI